MPEERLAMPLEERGKVLKIAKSPISFETPPQGKAASRTSSKDANREIDADMVAIGETVIQRRSRAFGACSGRS